MIKTPLSTVIGGAFWTPSATVIGGASKTLNQIIKSLFANNEQGFAYDPNDLSTMFQDAAGTVPVTGVGQAVGLVLDKSKGMTLGAELLTNGDFSNGSAMWKSVDGSGIPTNTHMSVTNGVMTCTGVDSVRLSQSRQLTQGKWYKLTCDVISTNVAISLTAAQGEDLTNMVVSIPFSLGNGKRTTYFYANYSTLFVGIRAGGAGSFSVDNITLKELTGNHAYQTTSASRPILQRNATTGAYYLAFDGTDDFLVTNNIDFTATDKVSLFAGVRKYVNSARVLCELSSDMNANPNSFYITAPETVTGAYGFKSRGSAGSSPAMTVFTQTASLEDSCVLSASGDISADRNTIRRNGLLFAISYDLGTGNYGNYPLYIGRRGGTSLPFNGHLYSLIGIGRLTTDSETIALEKTIAKNTGVTLNV